MTFKYKRLPIFCHYCELLGHDPHHCAPHFARKKNGDEVDYQHGEWLKSEGGRAKSAPKRSANLRWRSEDDMEDVLGQSFNHTKVAAELPMVEKEILGHVNSYHDKGIPTNHGIVPKSQQHDNVGIETDSKGVNIACVEDSSNVGQGADTVTKTVSRVIVDLNNERSNVQPVTHWAAEGARLLSTQSQGKLTRFNRMEFGLSGFTKALNLPTLGKKGTNRETKIDISCDQEGKAVKCGRLNVCSATEDDTLAGVVSHPYREQ